MVDELPWLWNMELELKLALNHNQPSTTYTTKSNDPIAIDFVRNISHSGGPDFGLAYYLLEFYAPSVNKWLDDLSKRDPIVLDRIIDCYYILHWEYLNPNEYIGIASVIKTWKRLIGLRPELIVEEDKPWQPCQYKSLAKANNR